MACGGKQGETEEPDRNEGDGAIRRREREAERCCLSVSALLLLRACKRSWRAHLETSLPWRRRGGLLTATHFLQEQK